LDENASEILFVTAKDFSRLAVFITEFIIAKAIEKITTAAIIAKIKLKDSSSADLLLSLILIKLILLKLFLIKPFFNQANF
jgi:hypothetical protein